MITKQRQFTLLVIIVFITSVLSAQRAAEKPFDLENDLLLLHYDFKTDVDDLHSAAAFATLANTKAFSAINYHAVSGTYGMQAGLYVPPNKLCKLAFGTNWSDADADFENAVNEVTTKAIAIIKNGGAIWIAEGGQSDFSAALLKAIKKQLPQFESQKRYHIVQHSDWNEETTTPSSLSYVKSNAHYQKIPDGNAKGNGTPGFRADDNITLELFLNAKMLPIWQLAIALANTYNGEEGRYLNTSMKAGGLDFSDFSEVCWILGISEFKDQTDYFKWVKVNTNQ